MFYLLEDNRIIDEDERAKKGQIIYVVDNYLHCTSLYEKKWLGKIKKQSENVFDLIELEEDLVRVDDIVCHCKYSPKLLREEHIKRKWVNAIYKPDANGNYIKVWEKKKDE